MRDCNSILKSMRICLAVDRDSNCLSECFGCDYINHDDHVMDMIRDAADAIEELLKEKARLENSGKLLVAAFDLAKEKLEKYRHAAFVIGETCVDESKCHISPEDAIKKIREHIYYDNTASCSDPLEEASEDA